MSKFDNITQYYPASLMSEFDNIEAWVLEKLKSPLSQKLPSFHVQKVIND
jgi:hypothetical protein